jgi:hypothetical protein
MIQRIYFVSLVKISRYNRKYVIDIYSILQYVNQCFRFESVNERKHNTKKKKIMLVYAFR